ncbi:MAG: hypothetical protein WAT66_07530 [Actinomycetota bacterium]
MRKRLRREEGITSVIVVICIVAFLGATMLSLDAGNLLSSRRNEITGTDAAALDAALRFNNGSLNPCGPDAGDGGAAEIEATNVLVRNNARSLHNDTDTPDGWEVTPADPGLCGLASYVPGKVRFDGRLPSASFFSQVFGVNNLSAISSSTAAWGYVTAIGDDLRPIPVCARSEAYQNWVSFWNTGDLTTYNSFFGRDAARQTLPTRDPGLLNVVFPSFSGGWYNGPASGSPAARNPNEGLAYIAPDGTDGHRTVIRVTTPDQHCVGTPAPSGDVAWIDFEDAGGGTIGASELAMWIREGYPGTVSLDPHDCNPANDNPTPESCGAKPGETGSVEKALQDVTCPVATPARSCPHVFPILVVDDISQPGSNAEYKQVAFLFVVMRGYGGLEAGSAQFDFEFLDVQTSGAVSGSPPSGSYPYTKGVQLCGADHADGNCPF